LTRFSDYLRTPLWIVQGAIALLLLWVDTSTATSLPKHVSAPASTIDSYSITYTNTPPIIDGLLDDKFWAQAKPTSDFVIHDSGKSAPVKTVAKLAYDEQYLYLAATSEDLDIYAHYTENQSYLFRSDDLVEIFIDPDGDGKHYLEVGFSAGTVHYSLLVPEVRDGKVEPEFIDIPELTYAVHINGSLNNADNPDFSWTLEARIPMKLLHGLNKKEPKGASWRIGIFRIDYSSPGEPDKASGFYAWQHLGKFGFHQPERFAYISFDKPSVP
jgi:hypothetical protein